MLEAATWTNPGVREFQDDVSAEPEIAADTVDLVRIFRDILERARNRPVFDVEEDAVTVGQMIQFLAPPPDHGRQAGGAAPAAEPTHTRAGADRHVPGAAGAGPAAGHPAAPGPPFSEIFIKKHTDFEAVMNEGLANARDDWR